MDKFAVKMLWSKLRVIAERRHALHIDQKGIQRMPMAEYTLANQRIDQEAIALIQEYCDGWRFVEVNKDAKR